jgi:hypothetical protein
MLFLVICVIGLLQVQSVGENSFFIFWYCLTDVNVYRITQKVKNYFISQNGNENAG